ncbi:MAG: DNA-directed RNA polymerase subunit K [Candidatus Woesearchaeota archaeon]
MGSRMTRYEKARVIGARAMQISMGAPFLIKLSEKELEELRYDPVKIAEKELNAGVLPIQVSTKVPGATNVK